jgi:hypothetical protein
MGCGVASAAAAQQAAPEKSASQPAASSVNVQQSRAEWWQQGGQPAASEQRPGPYLARPWQPAQYDKQPVNKLDLSDQHVIAISTLSLILIGVIVLLLVT